VTHDTDKVVDHSLGSSILGIQPKVVHLLGRLINILAETKDVRVSPNLIHSVGIFRNLIDVTGPEVRLLLGFEGEGFFVTNCYLNMVNTHQDLILLPYRLDIHDAIFHTEVSLLPALFCLLDAKTEGFRRGGHDLRQIIYTLL